MHLRLLLALPLLVLSPQHLETSPVVPVRVLAAFRAPASVYAAGHRGVDLLATPGQRVVSPMAGFIAFSGSVAGRPVVSIDDGRRRVSLEPVDSGLAIGSSVSAGQPLGVVGTGGHCSWRCVHLGLRVDGAYVAPLGFTARLVPWN